MRHRTKLAALAGVAVGYVWGARAGRARYDLLVSRAQRLWHTPAAQRAVHTVRRTVAERMPSGVRGPGEARRRYPGTR